MTASPRATPDAARGLIRRACAALVLALPLIGGAAQAQVAPPEAFYQPPAPLPEAAPGAVIRLADVAGSAALPGAARNLLVLYHSRDALGRDVAVSGTLAIPAGTPPPGGWPALVWFHGTTGIGPLCAPSRDMPDGPEHAFLGPKEALKDDYVRRGYAVVTTDYPGLGAPGGISFLQGRAEGRSGLDLLRAARAIDPAVGPDYVIWGHSQGGQAALFAAALAGEYAPELRARGVVALAPASHIGATLTAMAAAEKPSYALGYAIYVIQSFAGDHPEIDLGAILTPEALAHLPQTRRDCVTRTTTQGYWATAIPKDQFVAGADLAGLLAIAAANEPADLVLAPPALVAQGGADDTVLPAWTDAVAGGLCAGGARLDYAVYPAATHETIPAASAALVGPWIAARFAGGPAPENCAAPPVAAR